MALVAARRATGQFVAIRNALAPSIGHVVSLVLCLGVVVEVGNFNGPASFLFRPFDDSERVGEHIGRADLSARVKPQPRVRVFRAQTQCTRATVTTRTRALCRGRIPGPEWCVGG